jgi:hypothetical protein
MKNISIVLLVGLIACFSCANRPPQSNWKFIGDKWVSFGIDHDVIAVKKSDTYSKIKLRVTSGPLKVYDMKVHLGNGTVQDVSIRSLIPQGGESFVIDLNGGIQVISKIEFWYETKGKRKGKARVAVWGKR